MLPSEEPKFIYLDPVFQSITNLTDYAAFMSKPLVVTIVQLVISFVQTYNVN